MGASWGGIDPITGKVVGNEPEMEYDDWLMWFLIKYGDTRQSISEDAYLGGYPNTALEIGHMKRETEQQNDMNFEVYYQVTPKGKRYLEMLENYDRLLNASNDRRD